jgi:hypothetical protein
MREESENERRSLQRAKLIVQRRSGNSVDGKEKACKENLAGF